MTWTNPRTWTTDEVPSAATLNTHIRDNLNEIWRCVSYVEVTSAVGISATTYSTATTIVTAAAFTADGTSPLFVEFFSPRVEIGASTSMQFELYDGASSIGSLGDVGFGSTGAIAVHLVSPHLTPSAASHTYSVRGWTASPTMNVSGGAGGAGNRFPLWIAVWVKGAA